MFSNAGDRLATVPERGVPLLWVVRFEDLVALANQRIDRDYSDAELREYGPSGAERPE